jgi:hypothetical protein
MLPPASFVADGAHPRGTAEAPPAPGAQPGQRRPATADEVLHEVPHLVVARRAGDLDHRHLQRYDVDTAQRSARSEHGRGDPPDEHRRRGVELVPERHAEEQRVRAARDAVKPQGRSAHDDPVAVAPGAADGCQQHRHVDRLRLGHEGPWVHLHEASADGRSSRVGPEVLGEDDAAAPAGRAGG